MDSPPIRVLAIEDDIDYLEILRLSLEEPKGAEPTFDLDTAVRLAEGLKKLGTRHYDAVLVDMGLPDGAGLEVVSAVLRAAPDTPVLVSTNYGDESSMARAALSLGAQDFMIKASSNSRQLKRSIRAAIELMASRRGRAVRAESPHVGRV
jgi:DNA-binding NtrC family response regulator